MSRRNRRRRIGLGLAIESDLGRSVDRGRVPGGSGPDLERNPARVIESALDLGTGRDHDPGIERGRDLENGLALRTKSDHGRKIRRGPVPATVNVLVLEVAVPRVALTETLKLLTM